jgi:hypothetical protein
VIETAEIIYDDEEIRVIWHPGKTDFVLITFGDLVSKAREVRFFGDRPAGKGSITTIGIMAKSGNWYPKANLSAAYDSIFSKIEGYETRITYGGSMGGYASIKFSKLLGATHVMALCPQWSIDISECNGTDPGHQYYFAEHMRGMGIQKQDIRGKVFLFVDSSDAQDMFHCGMILRMCQEASFINVPMVGHHVTAAMAGSDNLFQLIEATRSNDIAALKSVVRRTRRNFLHRRVRIITYALKKFPTMGIRLLIKYSLDDSQIMNWHKTSFPSALKYLQQNEDTHKAIQFYERFWYVVDSPTKQLKTCSYLSFLPGAEIVIVTIHGSKLIYSEDRNTCYHDKIRAEPGDSYVKIEIFGSSAALFVMINSTRFYLAVDKQGNVIIPSEDYSAAYLLQFELHPRAGIRTALGFSGQFLSAEPWGKIICNRSIVNDWELFRFGIDVAPDRGH